MELSTGCRCRDYLRFRVVVCLFAPASSEAEGVGVGLSFKQQVRAMVVGMGDGRYPRATAMRWLVPCNHGPGSGPCSKAMSRASGIRCQSGKAKEKKNKRGEGRTLSLCFRAVDMMQVPRMNASTTAAPSYVGPVPFCLFALFPRLRLAVGSPAPLPLLP